MFVIGVLWTGFFLVNFNIAMMIPLLPFIGQALGLSTHQAGIVLAAFPVAALASNLAVGPWIDRDLPDLCHPGPVRQRRPLRDAPRFHGERRPFGDGLHRGGGKPVAHQGAVTQ